MIYLFIISIIIVAIITITIYLSYSYNRLVKLHDMVKDEYLVINTMIKKRNDLIPKLVEIVKKYHKQDKKLLNKIVEVRNKIIDANDIKQIVYYDSELSRSLDKLLIRLKKNKKINTNNDYINIKQELNCIEKNIEKERIKYNEVVLSFNNHILTFPSRFISKKLNYQEEIDFMID